MAAATIPPMNTSAAPPRLAQRLREATRALHQASERAGVMPALLRGNLPLAGFTRLQRNLHALYVALEAALQPPMAQPAPFGPPAQSTPPGQPAWAAPPAQCAPAAALAPLLALQLPMLARSAALAADLDSLHGAGWRSALPLLPATLAYAQRLGDLARHGRSALAAHAYVRFLGDLSGGQVLQKVVRQAYGLDGGAGTRFFDFGPPDQVAALAQRLRQALDDLPLDEAESEALVAEARWSFAQHVLLFEQLAAPIPG